MALPSPVPRSVCPSSDYLNDYTADRALHRGGQKKIIKPQFFESYRTERSNVENLDIGAAYLTKRAVAASVRLSELDLNAESGEAPWGGIMTKQAFATEVLPMMLKLQSLSSSEWLEWLQSFRTVWD